MKKVIARFFLASNQQNLMLLLEAKVTFSERSQIIAEESFHKHLPLLLPRNDHTSRRLFYQSLLNTFESDSGLVVHASHMGPTSFEFGRVSWQTKLVSFVFRLVVELFEDRQSHQAR